MTSPDAIQVAQDKADFPSITTEIKRLKLGEVKLLSDAGLPNARHMTHSTFARLVRNVERDGKLTSVPFAVWDKALDAYLVLSGNHRVMAARQALGDEHEADFMVTHDELDRDRRMAIQLSHNAIEGEDDPAVLKELYDSIDSVDWRLHAGLDDKTLQLLDEVEVGSLNEAALDFQTTTVVFLPAEHDQAVQAWENAKEDMGSVPDEVWVANLVDRDRFLDALDLSGRAYGIRNIATELMIALTIFESHRDDLQDGFLDHEGNVREDRSDWVPLEVLLGLTDIPPAAALVIQRALKRMVKAGDCTEANLWRAIELWAADYLAGADQDA
jgi:hypothetical protein